MNTFVKTTLINSVPDGMFKVSSDNKKLTIAKGQTFLIDNIASVYYSDPVVGSPASVSIDTAKVELPESEYGQISLILGLQGSQLSLYADAFGFRSKPMQIPFKVKKNGAKFLIDGKSAVDAVNKAQLNIYGEKVYDIALSGDVLTITSSDFSTALVGTQWFKYVSVDVEDEKVESLSNGNLYTHVCVYDFDLGATDKNITVTPGVPEFGSYKQIIKDFRLPTGQNMRWNSVNDEMPEMGATYHQYIINYEHVAQHLGFQAVGEKMVSATQHVFWVKDGDANTEFAANLKALGINVLSNKADDSVQELSAVESPVKLTRETKQSNTQIEKDGAVSENTEKKPATDTQS